MTENNISMKDQRIVMRQNGVACMNPDCKNMARNGRFKRDYDQTECFSCGFNVREALRRAKIPMTYGSCKINEYGGNHNEIHVINTRYVTAFRKAVGK